MSDKSFTFFELHFHEALQIGPKEIDGLGGNATERSAADDAAAGIEADTEAETTADSGGASGSLGRTLLGLGALAAAAYGIRKLLGSAPSGLDALDDIEELDDLGASEGDEDATAADDSDTVPIEVTSDETPESDGNTGLLVAAAVTLLVLLALAARKLLGDSVEEIELPDDLDAE